MTYPASYEYGIVVAATGFENAAGIIAASNAEASNCSLKRYNYDNSRTLASKTHVERM